MLKEYYTHYVRNTLIPFANGAFLAVALTNLTVIILRGGNFNLTAQATVTLMPLVFWLIVMTFSHPWIKSLPHKTRAAVMSLEAVTVVVSLAIMIILLSGLLAVQILILQSMVLVSFIGASYFNAFLTAKEEAGKMQSEEAAEEEIETPVKKTVARKTNSSTGKTKTQSKTNSSAKTSPTGGKKTSTRKPSTGEKTKTKPSNKK